MKKYRLKDRELQEKLDAISGGDFSKRLQDPAKSEKGFAVAYGDFPEINGLRHLSLFLADEIEEVPEYDPNAWNEWPDVEPPRHKLLRTEILTERIDWDTPEPRGGQSRFKGSGIFDGTEWYFYDATTRKEGETVRFRPWDDTTAPTKSTLNKKILQEIIKALESHPEAYDLGYLIDDVSEAANELPDEESEK